MTDLVFDPLPLRFGPGRAARDAGLIAARQLRVFRASPARLVFPIVQPVILLVLFVAIFSGLAYVPEVTYRQFLVPGIIIQNITLTAPTVGLGIVTDASTGLADRFRSLPMARSAVLVGRLMSEGLVFLAQVVVLIAVASLMGFRVHSGIPGIVGIMLDGVAFGVALGVTESWLALRLHDPETAQRALFVPMVPLAFISSAFTPIDRLPGWLQPVARANPVTAAVNVARTLADGGALGREPLYLLAWLAVLSVVPGTLAVRRWQMGTDK